MEKALEVKIEFYDNPKDVASPTYAWVSSIGETGGQGAALLFSMFYDKVLFNLGPCSDSTSKLKSVVTRTIRQRYKERGTNTPLLNGQDYTLTLVDRQKKPTKKINVKVFVPLAIKTKFSWRGEDYYAPMGVIALLQHIINELPDAELEVFSDAMMNTVSP